MLSEGTRNNPLFIMIVIKKNEIVHCLILIAGFNPEGLMITGLLSENISLGLKRRLQKIHAELAKAKTELDEDQKKLVTECNGDEEKENKELEILLNEEVKINLDKVSLQMIEDIKTSHNYDFNLIEKIAE